MPISITALCPVCGSTTRFQGTGEVVQPADVLSCDTCGLKLSYGFLQTRMDETAAVPEEVKPPKPAKARKKPPAKK